MALKLIGYHYDANIDRKIVGEAWDNLEYSTDVFNASDNHPRDKDGIRRSGGPWLMTKTHVVKTPSSAVTAWWDPHPIYHGQFVAPTPSTPPQLTLDLLEGYGPELWRRMAPDKPVMSLGNAIYELKDVPSMLKQRFDLNGLKDIANFNLAVNFGWIPLLSDTVDFVTSHQRLIKALEQLLRNNGRPVHRKYPVENYLSEDTDATTSDTGILPPGFSNPTLVSYAYGPGYRRLEKTSFRKRIWAAGQFRYWLPDMEAYTKSQYRTILMRRLLGLRPTPYNIYRALPWSWMIDWFTNIGDNIANLNAQVADRLICDYAYVMRSVESHAECTITGSVDSGPGVSFRGISATTRVSRIWKERVGASPFGFQVDPASLSPFQLSILSSLGAQRLGR